MTRSPINKLPVGAWVRLHPGWPAMRVVEQTGQGVSFALAGRPPRLVWMHDGRSDVAEVELLEAHP